MTTTVVSESAKATASPEAILRRLGFSRRGSFHRRGELRLEADGEWLSLSRPAPKGQDPLALVGRPGLWKQVGEGAKGRLLYPLPASVLRGGEEVDFDEDGPPGVSDSAPLLEACLLAVVADMAEEAPENWRPPDEEAVAAWTRDEGLTIQHGSVVRQVEVIREERRLALRTVVVAEVPEDLPVVRRQWLRAALCHAQDSWRLVRAGITDQHAAVAEVDLTGLPAAVIPALFPAGLASLRWMVAGLAETAEFLADPEAASKALDSWPPSRRSATKPKPKKQHHG